jgi:hypothetical protein
MTVTQLVLAWTLAQPGITAALTRPKRPEHIEESAAAVDHALPIMGRIGRRTELPNASVWPSIGRTRLSPVSIRRPSTPRSLSAIVHARSATLISRTSTSRVSPGWAPTTSIGPVTGMPGV